MNILINSTQITRVLLALVSLQLLYLPIGTAIPISRELVKRADINCEPKPPGTGLIIEDCLSAILSIALGKTHAEKNQYQFFGSAMGADVRFEILSWNFGTVDWQLRASQQEK